MCSESAGGSSGEGAERSELGLGFRGSCRRGRRHPESELPVASFQCRRKGVGVPFYKS